MTDKRVKRNQKRKELRLATQRAKYQLVAKVKSQIGDAKVRMVRTKDGVAFGFQSGLFGFDQAVVLPIPDEQIAGAVEDSRELGGIVSKLGLLVLSKLIHFNLAEGPDALGKALAHWADVDISNLTDKDGKEYTVEDIEKANAALDAQRVTQALMAGTNDVEDLNHENS